MKMQQALQYLIETGSPDAISRLLRLETNSAIETLLKILPNHFKTPVALCCRKGFALNQDFLELDLDACVSFKEADTTVDIKSASDIPLVTPANTPNVPAVTVPQDRQETFLGFVCRQLSINDTLSKQDKDHLINLINYLLDRKAKANIPNSNGTYPIKYLIECSYIPNGLGSGIFLAFDRMLKELNLETVRMQGHSILDMVWDREKEPCLIQKGEHLSLDNLKPIEPKQDYYTHDARFLFLFVLIEHISKKYPTALDLYKKSKNLGKLTDRQYNDAQWEWQWISIVTLYNIMTASMQYREDGDEPRMILVNIQKAAKECSETLSAHYGEIITKLKQENRHFRAQLRAGNAQSVDSPRPILMHPASTALAATTSTSISISIASSAPSFSEIDTASTITAASLPSQHK